jgi:catechol 2,3-dioxygenase-like lactoylglutathione lyase family enzyme
MKVTGFNHLSIGTTDLAKSVKFYENVLLLTEFAEQNEEGLAASLYLDRPLLKTARRAR